MEKKVLYILIAVVAVIVVAGVIIGAVAAGNNNGGSGGEKTTVTYHGNGGTCSGNETYQTTSDTVPLLTWDRSGYEAVGYTVSTDSTGTVYKYSDKVPSGVKDLYVKWEKANLTVTIINPQPGLKVTSNGNTLSSGAIVVSDENGTCKIKVENVTPGTYKFVKDDDHPNTYYVDEGGVHKYTLSYSGTMYSTGGHDSVKRENDNTELTFTLTNFKTLTLTFIELSS